MLEKIDLSKKLDKKEYKALMEELDAKLGRLQRICKEKKIPVAIVFEGLGAAGKGTMINRLIEPLDPRGFKVYTTQQETPEEKYYPFLWRFWNTLPGKGRISILDRSWYRILLNDRFDGKTGKKSLATAFDEINSFEEVLTDDNMILIKFFLVISQKEQKKRFKKLEDSKETAWRVTADDWKRNEQYDEYFQLAEEALEKTDRDNAPWTIIEAEDKEYASAKIASTVVKRLEEAIAAANLFGALFNMPVKVGNSSVFAGKAAEFMKTPYLGKNGHIAIKTNSVERAVANLEMRGVKFNAESAKKDAKGMIAIYLQDEICGFAVHLVRK